MICAKSYENIFKFVKVLHRILKALFSGHRVLSYLSEIIPRNSVTSYPPNSRFGTIVECWRTGQWWKPVCTPHTTNWEIECSRASVARQFLIFF